MTRSRTLTFNPFDLPRRAKRLMYLGLDGALIPLCLWAAHALRQGTMLPGVEGGLAFFMLVTGIGMVAVTALRLPWIKLDALEMRAIVQIGLAALVVAVAAIVLSFLLAVGAPRSVPLIAGALFFCGSLLGRVLGLLVLNMIWGQTPAEPVAIYGAGRAGIQLASALRLSREARAVVFVDDDVTLHGLLIGGIPVHPPRKLRKLVDTHGLKRVLLALPSAGRDTQRRLLKRLETLPVPVQVLPSYVDMMAGKAGLGDVLKPVEPDALLGRDAVELNVPEVAKAYAGRTVLVSGAGGSIGSELCRQILKCAPARVVLFEHSEFNLYTVERDLAAPAREAGVALIARLGSVTDSAAVARVMAETQPEIVLHAAAYKHVPLVEDNVLEGARNNIIGTQVIAEAAAQAGVERFILISTDKAVRPTNVMGATKRLAELVIQDLQTRHAATRFAMVRFGNVLGSSGSVLPLFQRQIAAGGPVTVTHPEVTRFFMTIPEAARLVLLAGAFAKGRDLFVLDMGQPQRILDIAHRMIALSGRSVRDPVTGKGDIEVVVTGLRPGEKLYEELLIDDASLVATPHPKILRAEEAGLSEIEVARMLQELRRALQEDEPRRLQRILEATVEGFGTRPAALP